MHEYGIRSYFRVFGVIIIGGVWLFWFTGALQAKDQTAMIIDIQGLSGDALQNVRLALQLPVGLVEDGKVDEFLAGRFAEQVPGKVRDALEPFGYYQPEVNVSWQRLGEDGYRLLVAIHAGEPIQVGTVHVHTSGPGAGEASLIKLVTDFPLRKGDILRQDVYEQAKNALFSKALDLGYLDASFSSHVIRISRERLTSDIELVLETGPRYHVGEISFTGTPAYPESFLRRYLEFKTGDIFSYEQMAKTQANFANADRFRELDIHARKEGAVDDRIPVDIVLAPSPAKSVRTGAGYGTDTGPRGTLRYRDVNVGRLGHELETELKVSRVLQGISVRYLFPGERDARSYMALTTSAQREDTTTYLTKSIKMEAEQTKGFGRHQVGSAFVQARVETSDAGEQSTDTFLLLPGVRFSEMRYDDTIRPRNGFNYKVEVKGTHQALGSSTGFIQFITGGDLVFPLPAQFSFILRARAGVTWQNDPSEDLPVSVRFFAGGDRSIRGYAYQSLGPKDDRGNVVGGRNLLTGSAEIERYIGKNWGIAAFYDAGNAFNGLSDLSAAQGAGAGLRYYSPIGPIKLDIARQLKVTEPDTRIHLTIGLGL